MEPRLKLILIATLILQISVIKSASDADWASKCNRCKCVWSDGKKFANCTHIQLSSIPTDMSSDIRDLDFSFNPLYELQGYVFSNANLSDVHKLKLQNCNIEQVHNKAFQNLLLLIELDLSNNNIQTLHRDVFKSTEKLRTLSLWNNNLTTLEPELFSGLSHLHQLFLDNNKLTTISSDLFSPAGCPLIHVGLANNRLTTIDVDFFRNVPRLSSFDLSGNWWNCDCNLQQFREQALERNLVTVTPTCHDPPRLRNKKWSDMANIFACQPKILDPTGVNTEVRVDGYTNYTLFCRIDGEPRPNVTWAHNNRPVDSKRNSHKYVITSSETAPFWHNLTIFSVNSRDKGDYKCTAANDGGSQTKTIILDIYEYSGGITTASPHSPQFTWLIIIVCLLILVFLGVILLLCCWCLRKRRHQQQKIKAKNNMSRSSEMMNFDGRSSDDKALITNVNPVNKPPRQHWVPSSVNSEGTDVSEAKKMLIDDESCVGDDESHSIFDYTSAHTLRQHRPPMIDPYSDHLDTSNLHYPPDLLAVPTMHSNHRAMAQVSPAASYASSNNTQITSILPTQQEILNQQLPLSPVHYPVPQYDTLSLMRYGTLPYSRSHSPFATSGGLVGVPVRVPRHGYVTIPRKPRTSWSSEPPGGLPEISEPLYDNLGLRTTATGSSVLSLNKEPSTPRSGRSSNGGLLSTPTSTVPSTMAHLTMIEPIVEHDSSMSPPTSNNHAVKQHSTLPRRYGATSTPKSTPLSEVSSDVSPIRNNPIQSVDTTPTLPSFESRPQKIPPLPPPKPKKNIIAKPTTAVFEDETEDGTEV